MNQGADTADRDGLLPSSPTGPTATLALSFSILHKQQSIYVQYDYRLDSLHKAIIRSDYLPVVIDGGYAITGTLSKSHRSSSRPASPAGSEGPTGIGV